MTKLLTSDSYLVRIYRVDSDDPHRLAGQLEALDGSGTCTPFTDSEQLAALLGRGAGPKRSARRRTSCISDR